MNTINKTKLSIIIPCFNEKATIKQVISNIDNLNLGNNFDKEIVVVDDCSTDGSTQIIKEFQELHKCVFHSDNLGKGAAIRSALKVITGSIVIIQDADLEYDPNDILALVSPILIDNEEVVYGTRIKNLQKRKISGILYFIGGSILTLLTNILFNARLSDEATGYKVFKRDLLEKLNLTSVGFEFCPEVTGKILKNGIRIIEIPINYNPRKKNEGKKIKLKDFIIAVKVLFSIKFSKSPHLQLALKKAGH